MQLTTRCGRVSNGLSIAQNLKLVDRIGIVLGDLLLVSIAASSRSVGLKVAVLPVLVPLPVRSVRANLFTPDIDLLLVERTRFAGVSTVVSP